MTTVILITGAGRSGMSSVAGSLKRCGFHIPQPEKAADDANPLGYYEPRWIARFHGTLLKSVPVRDIDTRPKAGELAMAALSEEREAELRDWLRDEVSKPRTSDVIVIKEVRAYWVYPLWQRVAAEVGVHLVTLTMLRHPTQVARSRDTKHLSQKSDAVRRQRETTNVAAWMNSVYLTERQTRSNRRSFVRYSDLLTDWRSALTRSASQLGVDLGDLARPHAVDEFLTPTLNRSINTWEGMSVSKEIRSLAEETWDAVDSLVDDPADATARSELDRLKDDYGVVFDTSVAVAGDATAADVAAVRRRLGARLENRRETIERLRARLRS